MEKTTLSVVVPCFNEEKRIYQNITRIHNYLKDRFEIFEIIAVNDGSADGTVDELKKVQQVIPVKIIDHPINQGKGKSVRDGVMMSQYEVVMFLDADLAIPIEGLDAFLAAIQDGNDLAIASRFVPGNKVLTPVLWYRKIMEKIFRILRMIILDNFKVQDTQCGFKVFSRRAALEIFPLLTIDRFAFDAEVIFIATRRKFRIKELPINLQNPVRTSVRIFRDSANMLIDLTRIRSNNLKGKYNRKVNA